VNIRLFSLVGGEWWQPANPDHKIGGILELGNKFELRLWGTMEDKLFPPLKPGFDAQIFHGQSLGNSLTLLDGQLPSTNVSYGGGGVGSVVLFRIPLAFIGSYWLDNKEEAKFDRVCAEVANLVEWSNQKAIDERRHASGKTVFEYARPAEVTATVSGGTITLSQGLTTSDAVEDVRDAVNAVYLEGLDHP
jgi:hypothetical protein